VIASRPLSRAGFVALSQRRLDRHLPILVLLKPPVDRVLSANSHPAETLMQHSTSTIAPKRAKRREKAMSIERRYHKRLHCELEAHLIFRGRCFSINACNLSAHGMGLKTGSLTIPAGNLINLELSIGEDRWDIAALVIYSDSRGTGIMFRIPQPELAHSLEQLQRFRPLPAAIESSNGKASNPA
jgi:hypothetical protein